MSNTFNGWKVTGTPEVSQKTEDFRSWRVEDRGEQEGWFKDEPTQKKDFLAERAEQKHTGPHNEEEPSLLPNLA